MFVVNVEGAIERDGSYLMIVRGPDEVHAPGALSFPGGKVETTDGPEAVLESTLRREIREEIGVEIDERMTYVKSGSFELDDGRKALNVVFLCHLRAGTPIADSEEVHSVRWMTSEQILRDRPPWFKALKMREIEEARRREDGTAAAS